MNDWNMKLEQSNMELQLKVNQLIKEKAELIEIIKENVNNIKAIEDKINSKEKEFMEEMERLINENYLLKKEVVMINKEKINIESLYKESENMVMMLKTKVFSLSKLIIENEKIRNELSHKLSNSQFKNINELKINENKIHKAINIPLLKLTNENTINDTQPHQIQENISSNEHKNNNNKKDSSKIWNIISNIKSHISQEQLRLNSNIKTDPHNTE